MTHPRSAVAPIHLSQLPVTTTPRGTGRIAIQTTESGGFTAILDWPGPIASPNADKGFEYHTGHEEIFILNGSMHFHDHYDWKPLGYINHPPYWIHPANQHSEDGCRLLVKMNKPVDFVFKPIPEDWGGYEYIDLDTATVPPGRGISNLQTDDLPWEPVLKADGTQTGYDGKRLYDDPNTGWITWLMRVPAGWRGTGSPQVLGGGDELFLVDGDLTVWRDEPVGLVSDFYYCDPDTIYDGGDQSFSTAGCTAIRWSFKPSHLQIPPLRY